MSSLKTFFEMVKRNNFVVLDTETTGLERGEICQIAIINHTGTPIVNTLVKTVNPIPRDAHRIHGIDDAMVANAPGWKEVAPLVRAAVSGRDVIIYNAVYDRKMMHQSAEACGMDKIDWKEIANFYCAMEAFAEVYGEWNEYHQSYRWQRLTTAAHYYDLPVVDAHSAIGDCIMTLGVVRAMLAEHEKDEAAE